MAKDKDLKETLDLDLSTEGHSFDGLAKGLASRGISRGRMLTMVGTAITSGLLGTLAFPNESEAKKRKKKRKKKPAPTPITTCSDQPCTCPGYIKCGGFCCNGLCCDNPVTPNLCLVNDGKKCCPSAYPIDGRGWCGPLEKCCQFSCCLDLPDVACGPDPQIPCV
jgi:hypothetical protein